MAHNQLYEINYQLNGLILAGLTNIDKPVSSPVLCIHGWLDNAASFKPLFQYMKNTELVAIDLAGHGHSSHRSKDAHYHFIDYIYDLLALFEVNQWKKLHLVGHSMGGMVASAFAAAFPEKVVSLTLIDSIGFVTEKVEKTTVSLRAGLLSRLQNESKQKSYHSTIHSAIEARMNVADLNYQQAKLLVERGILLTEKGYIWRSDSRLRTKSPVRLTMEQASQFICDINVPVQLIFADKGLAMIKKGLNDYQKCFKKLTIHSLSGGHHIHMEQPKKTAEMLLNFIYDK
jgi:pimeloyl-ACP methyl ester carboxylesterase